MLKFSRCIQVLKSACLLSSFLTQVYGLQRNTDVPESAGATRSGQITTLILGASFLVVSAICVAGCLCISRAKSKGSRLKDPENPHVKKPNGIKSKHIESSADRRTKPRTHGARRTTTTTLTSLSSHKKHRDRNGNFVQGIQYKHTGHDARSVHRFNPVFNLPSSNQHMRTQSQSSNGVRVDHNETGSSLYVPSVVSLQIDSSNLSNADSITQETFNPGTLPLSPVIVVPASSSRHHGPPSAYFTSPGGSRNRRGGKMGTWGYRGTPTAAELFGNRALQQNGTLSGGRRAHDVHNRGGHSERRPRGRRRRRLPGLHHAGRFGKRRYDVTNI